MIPRRTGPMLTLALTLALVLILAHAFVANAPCGAGLRFLSGPVTNGHNRQPTPAEFEARKRAQEVWSRTATGSCATTGAGDGASLPASSKEPSSDPQ
jgi:hypothetical protein